MNKTVTSKDAIINASRELAIKKGLSSINMRAVANECSVAVGSVYNYFPSKAELVTATIESVWKSIFHMPSHHEMPKGFIGNLQWVYNKINAGTKEYPTFFTLHSMSFASVDKAKGKETMERYFVHMKKSLMHALEEDSSVKENAFNNNFTKDEFIEFVFSNLISSLMKREDNISFLLEMIKRTIY